MDTAESVSSLLMKSLSLTPLYQWHRWVCLLVINDIAEIDFTVLMTLQIFCLKIYYLHKTDFIFENISLSGSKNISEHCPYNVKRRNQWILRKDSKDVIKLSSPPKDTFHLLNFSWHRPFKDFLHFLCFIFDSV